MTARGTTVTGTVLLGVKFRGFSCAQYNFTPYKLQNKCDCCYHSFYVHHALNIKNDGLVIARHNKVNNELVHLVKRTISLNCI